jgi:hypothetical protein
MHTKVKPISSAVPDGDLMLFTVPKTAVLVDALTMVLVNHSGS